MKPVRITKYENPDKALRRTSWGRMTYREWCRREAERISSNGRRAWVRANTDGQVAVFVG